MDGIISRGITRFLKINHLILQKPIPSSKLKITSAGYFMTRKNLNL